MIFSTPPQIQFTFHIPVDDWKKFTLIAFKRRTSRNALLREAVLDLITKYTTKKSDEQNQ